MQPKTLLRRTLFWDVDTTKLDTQTKADFIIGRVLDFGDINDLKMIRTLYRLNKIKEAALKHPFESARSKNFWEMIFNLPPRSLSCKRKLLPQIPSAFLRRSAKLA